MISEPSFEGLKSRCFVAILEQNEVGLMTVQNLAYGNERKSRKMCYVVVAATLEGCDEMIDQCCGLE